MADFLFKVFCHHGWPQVIISDQEREFVNDLSRYEKVFACELCEWYLCAGASSTLQGLNIV